MIPINKCFLSCVSLYTLSLFHFKRNYTQRQEKIHLLSTLICDRCNSSHNRLSSYTALAPPVNFSLVLAQITRAAPI